MGTKGLGGLIALLGLVLIMSREEGVPVLPLPFVTPFVTPPLVTPPLTAESFSPTFITPPTTPTKTTPPFKYKKYYEFVTQPAEDVEADPAITLTPMAHPQLDRPPGEWLTVEVKGKPYIPTPTGALIPLPTRRVGRIAVETMLEPIGGEDPAEEFADVEYNGRVRKSVSARLTEIVNGAVTPPVTPTRGVGGERITLFM